jgi:hypothetical protein
MLSPAQIAEAAHDLRFSLHEILEGDLGCYGFVSYANCYDVIFHLDRDIDRLYALHQKLVHPSKHVAYTAFWIRKIKPVSSAFFLSDMKIAEKRKAFVDEKLEVADINERVCLYYIWRSVATYIEHDQIALPKNITKDRYIENVERIFQEFVADRSTGPALNNRFNEVLYDMRYRTFGPHHLVHIATYLLREATDYGR